MKVILKEDVQGVGVIGDMVNVNAGFARNFLIPRKLAVSANPRNLKELEHHKRSIAKRREKILATASTIADKINKLTIEITASVGSKGKLYGSVTTIDIADELAKKNIELDRRKIEMPEPIKRIGEYAIPIKLDAGVKAELKLSVIPDAPVEEESAEEEAGAEKEAATEVPKDEKPDKPAEEK